MKLLLMTAALLVASLSSVALADPQVDSGNPIYADTLQNNPPRYITSLAQQVFSANDTATLRQVANRTAVVQREVRRVMQASSGSRQYSIVMDALDSILDLAAVKIRLIEDAPASQAYMRVKTLEARNRGIKNDAYQADDILASLGLLISDTGVENRRIKVVIVPPRPVGPGLFTHKQDPTLEPSWVRFQRAYGKQNGTRTVVARRPTQKIAGKRKAAGKTKVARVPKLASLPKSARLPKSASHTATLPPASGAPTADASIPALPVLSEPEKAYIDSIVNFLKAGSELGKKKVQNLGDAQNGLSTLTRLNEKFQTIECPQRFDEINLVIVQAMSAQVNVFYFLEQAYTVNAGREGRNIRLALEEANLRFKEGRQFFLQKVGLDIFALASAG